MNSLKVLRAASGTTQEELAEKLGVAASTLSRWENGRVEPSNAALAEKAIRLAEARVPNARLVEALR